MDFSKHKEGLSIGLESLVWLSVFVLLTISNISFDLLLSVLLSAILTVGMWGISWVNRVFFIPRMFSARRQVLYFLTSSVVLIVAAYLVSLVLDKSTTTYFASLNPVEEGSLLDIQLPSENKPFFTNPQESGDSRLYLSSLWKSFILFLLSQIATLMLFFHRKAIDVEKKQKELMQEKVQMELNFLRSQINPHFLFNALNNIYSMVYMGDKNAADSVLTLSEMLRYVTYESKEERILLSGEISYLENFIEFQRFSYENDVNVNFEKHVASDGIYIAPMLLQPFVENAFKYSGVGLDEDAYIHIFLSATKESLDFRIENSVRKTVKKEKKSGIGVENVHKRLELSYPNKYRLDISSESEKVYELRLHIELDSK